jgi:hypothetical protein
MFMDLSNLVPFMLVLVRVACLVLVTLSFERNVRLEKGSLICCSRLLVNAFVTVLTVRVKFDFI